MSHDGPPVSISCVANTSQPCNYRWRGTLTSIKDPIEILGQTLHLGLFKQDFEDMICSAECRIRDKDCTVEPLRLIFFRAEGEIFVSHCSSPMLKIEDKLPVDLIAGGIHTILMY